jgi:hypothetical protein
MSDKLLHEFEREVEVLYEGEAYLVRDNGAVLRRSRPDGRRRKLDNVWTFGRKEPSPGYMAIGSHIVHRIVAFAFHPQPTPKHIVDHIDTNRANNRAENLRWLTRLENVLRNPITMKRVIQIYGSLEAFFNDPTTVIEYVPDFSWMRTVSKEEAAESRRRLLSWAASTGGPKGGRISDRVYRPQAPRPVPAAEVEEKRSATPNALQRRWKVACEFPACPQSLGSAPLTEYKAALVAGSVFSRNDFGESLTEQVGSNGGILAVLTRMPASSAKDWALAQVTIENGLFVHESHGTFFSREGALNAFNELLGVDAPQIETIDDYA